MPLPSLQSVLAQIHAATNTEEENQSQASNQNNTSTKVALRHLQEKEVKPFRKNELSALLQRQVIDLSDATVGNTSVPSAPPSIISPSTKTPEILPPCAKWEPLIALSKPIPASQTPRKRSPSSERAEVKRLKTEFDEGKLFEYLQNITPFLNETYITVKNRLDYIELILSGQYSTSPKVKEYLFELQILKAECLQKLGRNKKVLKYINSDLITNPLFEKYTTRIYLIQARSMNRTNSDFKDFYDKVTQHPKEDSLLSVALDVEKIGILNSLSHFKEAHQSLLSIQERCYQTQNQEIIGYYQYELVRTLMKLNRTEEARLAAIKGEEYPFQDKYTLAKLRGLRSILEIAAHNLTGAKELIDSAINVGCPNEKLHLQLLDQQEKINKKFIAASNALREKNESASNEIYPSSDIKDNNNMLVPKSQINNNAMDISSNIISTTTSSANVEDTMDLEEKEIAYSLISLSILQIKK